MISPTYIYATDEIVFNEVMAEPDSGDEWIELYNPSSESRDLSGWYVHDSVGNEIPLTNPIIAGHGFITVDCTDILNNSGDTLTLYAPEFDEGYPVSVYTYGSSTRGKTFARIPDGELWKTKIEPTKGKTNGEELEITPTPTPIPAPTPTPALDYSNISITEIYPSTNVGEKEWVEFYNDNDSAVSFDNWYLTDSSNGKKYINNFIIAGKSYATFEFTSGFLNNTGDMLTLYNHNQEYKTALPESYPEIAKSYSWAKIDDSWCLAVPTKSEANISCTASATPSPTPTPSPSPSPSPAVLGSTSTPSTKPIFETTKTPTTKKTSNNDQHDRKTPKINTPNPTATPNPGKVAGISTTQVKNNNSLTLPLSIAASGLVIMAGVAFPFAKPKIINLVDRIKKR